MARPTSTIYRWCTTTANRVAASAAAKIAGFAAGDPVPSGVHNDIMGFLSDWVQWLALRSTTLVVLAPYFPWIPGVASIGGTPVTIEAATTTLRINAASSSPGRARFGVPVEGGLLTGVSVVVSAIDVTTGGAGTAIITATLFNADGTAAATYTDTITTTGTKVLPVSGTAAVTTSRDGWLIMTVRPGTETAHYIELGTITFTFSAGP